ARQGGRPRGPDPRVCPLRPRGRHAGDGLYGQHQEPGDGLRRRRERPDRATGGDTPHAMTPYQYAIVGAGWRAEFFLRISAALPERLDLLGLVVRNPEKARSLEARWGCRTWPTPEALLEEARPQFWVSSVSYAANFDVNMALLATGLPLLSETPPAATLEQL